MAYLLLFVYIDNIVCNQFLIKLLRDNNCVPQFNHNFLSRNKYAPTIKYWKY